MSKRCMILTMFFILVLTTICLDGIERVWEPAKVEKQDVETIAQTVCKGVCTIGEVFKGTIGAPILIFEENHISRVGQLEHAIAMVRLYKQYNLRHIALEGNLIGDREIRTDWFDKAAHDLTLARKFNIAVSLIKEGEISSAEFMKLAYKDVLIHPIEKREEYPVEIALDKNASTAPILYLLKIAYKSLKQEHIQKLVSLQTDFEKFEGVEKEKKRSEMFNFILSTDAWVQEKYKILTDGDILKKITLVQFVSMLEEIKNRANELSVELTAEEKKAMGNYIRFWLSRDKASDTMVNSVEKIADQSDVSIVAMNVGSAHTEKICKLLKASDRPYAVFTPMSFSRENGDLTTNMLDRKYKKLSVYSEGFTKILLKALSSSTQIKPPSVLSEPWFQGKAELYLFIEHIVERVLEGGGAGGQKPPYGFSEGDLRGNWVSIDPLQISYFNNDQSVLFPVILNPSIPEKRTTIWVKAKRSKFGSSKTDDSESVEAMLERALRDVQAEDKTKDKIEDEGGRVQITLDTVAGIAETKQAAEKIKFI